ncbi:MAG: Rieske 2Fe-2S domain-containing protein, partial [Gammaproteobacteria bacterium]|nr:Rieske 2Fe-2S domain-containing protein [Gammaproteobacteria bacterium]
LRVDRRIFTDPDLFELELRFIFEGTWIYLAHESQIPNPNDFMTGHMGRQPIILNRNASGELGGFINACAHRGSTLVQKKRGNLPFFACPFHGWCFDS